MKLRLWLVVSATAVCGLIGVSAAGAQAQHGLVNVAVVNNTVQLPIGVAANVCGVTVNLLASATSTAPVDCTAVAGASATGPAGGGGGGGGAQNGLINLYVANNTVQLPIGIAANICGVAANVLASETHTGAATCDARGNGSATV